MKRAPFFRSIAFRVLAVCVILGLLGAAALGVLIISAQPKEPMPILMYHHLVPDGEECNDMTVTASRMEADLQWLQENGYHTVLPRELAAGQPLPDKPVMITLDDGYRSNYELLYPLLQKYQMKAVISVVVSLQDVRENHLTWDMCREMVASGLVEIGSHTYALHNLDRDGSLDPDGTNGIERLADESDEAFAARVLDDIQLSCDRITGELGETVSFFAYPYGRKEPDAEDLIGTLFPVTATTEEAVADLSQGIRDLPRYSVSMDRSLDSIFHPGLVRLAKNALRDFLR